MAFAHFKLFRDLGLLRSFSRAAQSNSMSQSATSQHVQELERHLGVQLIDRSTRPFTLTTAGRLYHQLCDDILLRKSQFDADLADLHHRAEGTVRVAAIYSVGLGELRRLEEEFAHRCPHAKLEVEYLRPEKVEAAILEDRADLGLVSYPRESDDLVAVPWREEEMVVACSPRHPLARRRDVLPFELNGLDFIAFDDDLPIGQAIDDYLRKQIVTVNRILHFDNIALIKEAVAHSANAFAIVPKPILEADVNANRLAAIPLGPPRLIRPLGILYSRRKRLSKAGQAFLRLLEESEELLALPVS